MPRAPKSRNGCITCRRKRLKCDEAKPSCQRCTNSRTHCEGYRKREFQWRFVDQEALGLSLPATSPSTRRSSSDGSGPAALHSAFVSATHAFAGLHEGQCGQAETATPDSQHHESSSLESPCSITDTLNTAETEVVKPLFSPRSPNRTTVSPRTSIPCSTTGDKSPPGPKNNPGLGSYLDLDLSQMDLLCAITGLEQGTPGASQHIAGIEEPDDSGPVPVGLPDETPAATIEEHRGNSFSDLEDCNVLEQILRPELLIEPSLDVSSPDALLLRYNQDTCGILSLKDGPSENPWRTLIGPLSSSSLAVRCAISSMAASHGSYDNPSLRLSSINGRSQSIKALLTEIDNFRLVPALATSLVLAFAEGWEEPINCTHHLRGARGLVRDFMQDSNAVTKLQDGSADSKALRYLCNTFVYIDVISRLTSLEEEANQCYEDIVSATNFPTRGLMEVDPLLGCASSLFPMLARVANIVQKVRKGSSISLNLISEAGQLQEQLQQWVLPNAAVFQSFEDSTSQVRHAVITADALRYAALLYLHQAIPEILSEPDSAKSLARKVLVRLATVPPTSRALNTHIFPLLIAGCEVTDSDDRDWVKERWKSLAMRLKVRNVDCCWRIVKEVWSRRDLDGGEGACCPPGCSHGLGFKYKVGCKLHWLSAMLDMHWEVFAG